MFAGMDARPSPGSRRACCAPPPRIQTAKAPAVTPETKTRDRSSPARELGALRASPPKTNRARNIEDIEARQHCDQHSEHDRKRAVLWLSWLIFLRHLRCSVL